VRGLRAASPLLDEPGVPLREQARREEIHRRRDALRRENETEDGEAAAIDDAEASETEVTDPVAAVPEEGEDPASVAERVAEPDPAAEVEPSEPDDAEPDAAEAEPEPVEAVPVESPEERYRRLKAERTSRVVPGGGAPAVKREPPAVVPQRPAPVPPREVAVRVGEDEAAAIAAEPGEVRIRRWLLPLLVVILPIALCALAWNRLGGVLNPDAIDYAQIARNMSEGRGFTTLILRPLALTHGSDPMRQPDVTHGPLYPFVLALAFGGFGAKDGVVALVSAVFFVLSAILVYLLGSRVFDRTVGAVAAALYGVNAAAVGISVSGLPVSLYACLATALCLALYPLARGPSATLGGVVPRLQLVLVGALASALYLANPVFFWVVPTLLVVAVLYCPGNRLQAAGWFLLPVCFIALPWMIRNWALTRSPIWGLTGMELYMHNRRIPGFEAYRMMVDEVAGGSYLVKELAVKAIEGVGAVLRAYPDAVSPWLFGFFVVGLLSRRFSPAQARLRRALMALIIVVPVGALVFRVNPLDLAAFVPSTVVFATALLVYLLREARLRPAAMAGAGLVMAFVFCYQTAGVLALGKKAQPGPAIIQARELQGKMPPGDAAISDQPWLVAWYAHRPAIWAPRNVNKTLDLRKQFPQARWLFLTEQTGAAAPEWTMAYNLFRQWGVATLVARRQNRPLPGPAVVRSGQDAFSQALAGFTGLEPTSPEATPIVIAALPPEKK